MGVARWRWRRRSDAAARGGHQPGREGRAREERNGGLQVSPAAFGFRHAQRSGVAGLQGVSPRTFGNRPSLMFKNAFKNDHGGHLTTYSNFIALRLLEPYKWGSNGIYGEKMCGGSPYMIVFK